MDASASYIFIIGFVLSGVFVVAYLISSELLLSWIRQRHSDIYKELGEPSLFGNNTISNGNRVVKFLLSQEYLALSEARTIRLGRLSRALLLTAAATLALSVIAFFVQTAGYY